MIRIQGEGDAKELLRYLYTYDMAMVMWRAETTARVYLLGLYQPTGSQPMPSLNPLHEADLVPRVECDSVNTSLLDIPGRVCHAGRKISLLMSALQPRENAVGKNSLRRA